MRTVNLKDEMPIVEVARARLGRAIEEARRDGTRAVKLIHGYGSSGVGGAIRDDVRPLLAAMRRGGSLTAIVPGEEFGPGHQAAIDALDLCPALRADADYGRSNRGITIVVLATGR